MRKSLPVGVQTFSTMIERDYLYIDKTRDIYNLITTGQVYFLSRPRRFGKTLLISTLAEIFAGHRELFEGCGFTRATTIGRRIPSSASILANSKSRRPSS